MTNGNLGSKGARLRLRPVGDERLVARVRGGDTRAFEALYDRHAAELLTFCAYLLSSRHDAEDAVQCTFAAAYRSLRANGRPVALRPWLFTIARNQSLSILRKRRPQVELNGEPAPNGDPHHELEVREEVRDTLRGLQELPEAQRAALVLAELHGMSQTQIATVLGVRAEQVKAYVYQARGHLISDRRAREADCLEIRRELASARGAALLRRRLRRHLRSCAGCRSYADGVAHQRHQLSCLLPLTPSLMLKYRALEQTLLARSADPAVRSGAAALGGSVAGAAMEIAGGGVKGLTLKLAAGLACLGATACVGATMLEGSASTAAHHGALPAGRPRSGALAGVPAPGEGSATTGGEVAGAGATAITSGALHRQHAGRGGGDIEATREVALLPLPAVSHPALTGEGTGTQAAPAESGPAARELASASAPSAATGPRALRRAAASQGAQRDEGRPGSGAVASAGAPGSGASRAHEREERQREREERQREREQGKREREQEQRTGAAGSPGGGAHHRHHGHPRQQRPGVAS